jgi:phage terminase large subunit
MRFKHNLTGNEIILYGMDDPEKIKSIAGITGVWCEEATELNEGDFNQLELRVRGETENYKQFILTFNPINEDHWLKKRFFDSHDSDVFTLRTTFLDNAFLDDDYKKHLKERVRLNENLYKIYVLGEWGSEGDGNIIKREWFTVIDYVDFLKEVQSPQWEMFVDSAYTEKTTNDPTAIMVACHANNNIYIKDSRQAWMEFPQLIQEIKNLAALNNASRVHIEPKASGKSIAQQLRRETTLNIIELDAPKEDKTTRLNACASVIEGRRVFLIKGNWNDNLLNEVVRFPNGLHDDQVDNLSAVVNKYVINKHGRRAVSL